MDTLGEEIAENIEWSSPRLLCIAGDFNRYDEHAVQVIDRNIELIRYRKFGDDLLLLELVNATSTEQQGKKEIKKSSTPSDYKTISDEFKELEGDLLDRFEALKSFLLALGDDIQMKFLKYYIAFKRIKNFACVEFYPTKNKIVVFVKVDPKSVELEKGFTRDVTNIGHYGTGELEISITSDENLEKAKELLAKSYDVS